MQPRTLENKIIQSSTLRVPMPRLCLSDRILLLPTNLCVCERNFKRYIHILYGTKFLQNMVGFIYTHILLEKPVRILNQMTFNIIKL